MKFKTTEIDSPVGVLLLGATDAGVCVVEFGSPERVARERAELERLLDVDASTVADAHLEHLRDELFAYFEGRCHRFTVPLDTPGTPWQQRVWGALCEIPFGVTTSYGRLAAGLGSPGGARAVGLANGQNRVAIVIPCHRVIESGGGLRGYGGGLERKRWLLDHEEAASGQGLFATARAD